MFDSNDTGLSARPTLEVFVDVAVNHKGNVDMTLQTPEYLVSYSKVRPDNNSKPRHVQRSCMIYDVFERLSLH